MTSPDWLDDLLAKLTVRYGRAFADQWRDMDPAYVKADWAEVLAGFRDQPEAIAFAIENLPDKPLNATQFRNLARQCPMRELMRLADPKAPMPDRVQAEIDKAKVRGNLDPRSPAQKVADGLIERLTANPDKPSRAQRLFMAQCEQMLPAGDQRRHTLRMLGFDIPRPVEAQ